MLNVLLKAGCFVAAILLGIFLRRIGFFKKEDFGVLSRLVTRVTLTGAVVANFSSFTMDYKFLIFIAIGFGFAVLQILVQMIMNKNRGREAQAFGLLNVSGCNIGCFGLPFAQNFFGVTGVVTVCFFDVGNSLMCLGTNLGIAKALLDSENKFSIKPILKVLSRSVVLMTYVAMTILSIFHLHLPGPVVQFATMVGSGNAFLAMLMIGVGFELSGNRSQLGESLRGLGPRTVISVLLAIVCFLYLPMDLECRQALVVLFLTPVPSVVPAYVSEAGLDYGLSAAINSVSIVISIGMIVAALMLIL